MLIHLIRHGDTAGTEGKLYYGSTDLPLSPTGQKKLIAQREQGGYPCIDGLRVYTSGMLRTEETLSLLYGDVPHDCLRELREMEFGEFEMRSYEQLKDDPAYICWISGDIKKNVVPGGESAEMFGKRVHAAFEEVMAKGEDCLMVLHGGVISCLMEYLFPGERKNFYEWQPKPGEGYTIEFSQEKICRSKLPAPYWQGKGFAFFQNRACEYFPCHKTSDPENFNCMFCYCPLYALGDKCGGSFKYTEDGVKDCSGCLVPHKRENFGYIMDQYPRICVLAAQTDSDNK